MTAHRYKRIGVDQVQLREDLEATLTVGHCSSLTEVEITLTDDTLRPDLDLLMLAHGYEYLASGDCCITECGGETTSGVETKTAVLATIPNGFHGVIAVDVTAEGDGGAADAYVFQNIYGVSGDPGGAAIRATNPTPIELDPNAKGVSVALDTDAQTIRVRVTGIALEDWTWGARIKGLLHAR